MMWGRGRVERYGMGWGYCEMGSDSGRDHSFGGDGGEFGVCSKCRGKPWESLKQEKNRILPTLQAYLINSMAIVVLEACM